MKTDSSWNKYYIYRQTNERAAAKFDCFFLPAKTDEVLKAKVAKREEEARKKEDQGKLSVCVCVCVCAYFTNEFIMGQLISQQFKLF